ncbi:hypothetical protein KDA_44900 [Dictyobacter alpinus]|uniref:Uncharacterized protein n=1 Tax=Dictyobacter alpinus TaxID=2014873 RepID=A0A402BCF2_9CHLR|nr:DUF5946 family protein [Dictyobacter alpinus]GCE29006.1 hypothetical protein KDA_44900 [Dictyobacter alpinus]
MSTQCEWCGALLPGESSCQAIHEDLLNFEALNSIPHSIHFLHVTCFLIQHNRYSAEGLAWARSMLATNLKEGMTEEEHFRSLRTSEKTTSSSKRTWNFYRGADEAPLPKIVWTRTIVTIYPHIHDPRMYNEHVRQWSRSTLQDMIEQKVGVAYVED